MDVIGASQSPLRDMEMMGNTRSGFPWGEVIVIGAISIVCIGLMLPVRNQGGRLERQQTKTLSHLKHVWGGLSHMDTKLRDTLLKSESRSGLSWRVHLLPYLGEHKLYRKFHLDEAWDSPHNQRLLDKMPAIYQVSGQEQSRQTRFRLLKRNDGPLIEAADSGAQLLVLVVGPKAATPWTRPDPEQLQPSEIMGDPAGNVLSIWSDGSSAAFTQQQMQELLKARP